MRKDGKGTVEAGGLNSCAIHLMRCRVYAVRVLDDENGGAWKIVVEAESERLLVVQLRKQWNARACYLVPSHPFTLLPSFFPSLGFLGENVPLTSSANLSNFSPAQWFGVVTLLLKLDQGLSQEPCLRPASLLCKQHARPGLRITITNHSGSCC